MPSHQILTFSSTATATATRAAELDPLEAADGFVARTPALRDVLERVRRVAPTDAAVLITGETGTGKGLLARAIHRRSHRATRPLVSANLAALPDTLAAAELFGHEKGAFTGAERLRVGRFETADRATLFLDEVGELSAELQVMLLRVLQEGEFERLGGSTTRHVDVRLIAATNRDLPQAIQEGRFREDLFYRLSVFPIHLPPLRERPDDIPAMAESFLHRAAVRLHRSFSGIEPASLGRLQQYSWPGNIRQLENVIEHSAILCDDGPLCVPPTVLAAPNQGTGATDMVPAMFGDRPTLEDLKRRYISHLLTTTRGNMLRAAAILDVDRKSLYRMVARYQLPATRDRKVGTSSPTTQVD